VLKTLERLGLTVVDVQVYLYLSKKGPLKVFEIASALKITETQIHLSLNNLVSKEMVHSATKYSAVYTAISFEKVLDEFMRKTEKETEFLQANRNNILSKWTTTDKI
jgi:sugar-specific transcriptional regulator TrmB